MLIYGAIGFFGFMILVVMLFLGDLGGGDHDFGGHDVAGHEIGHGDADHGGPSVFSARIMAAFLTAFGVGGVVARYYNLPHPAASGIGVASGIVMAGAVYQFAKILYSQQASSEVKMTSLVGRHGEVSIAIPEGGVGQIAVTFGGERSEHIARSSDGRPLPRGTSVVITALRGDSVVVALSGEGSKT
jgi:membrane protein implicated in regulation of membrane protease activity